MDGVPTGTAMNRRTIRIVNRLLGSLFGWLGIATLGARRARARRWTPR